MTNNKIEMIVAMGLDNAIGKDNKLLWNLKDDMKHFVKKTKGKNVVMGRKTFDSLSSPLKGRHNYVLSNSIEKHLQLDETTFVTYLSYDELMSKQNFDFIVIGGSEIYNLFITKATKIYCTLVQAVFPEADTHFPKLENRYKIDNVPELHKKDVHNDYDFYICELVAVE